MILKNNKDFLPLDLSKIKRIAVIGTLAKQLEIKGENLFDFLQKMTPSTIEFDYEAGHLDTNEVDETVMNQAQRAAAIADLIIIFVGFLDEETRKNATKLPTPQNVLVDVVSQVKDKVVVVLCIDTIVRMPWKKQVKSILKMGEEWGEMIDLLFTEVVIRDS